MGVFFFFNDTATTEIYTVRNTLSLHDALPISSVGVVTRAGEVLVAQRVPTHRDGTGRALETIVELIAAVRREAEGRSRAIAAIGVGVPGPVDTRRGRIGED